MKEKNERKKSWAKVESNRQAMGQCSRQVTVFNESGLAAVTEKERNEVEQRNANEEVGLMSNKM